LRKRKSLSILTLLWRQPTSSYTDIFLITLITGRSLARASSCLPVVILIPVTYRLPSSPLPSLVSPSFVQTRLSNYQSFPSLTAALSRISAVVDHALDRRSAMPVGFWASVCKTVRPMLLNRCLSVLSCLFCPVLSVTLVYGGQTVGWIKVILGMQVGLGPGHIVLDGNPAALPQRGTAPNFRPISVAAKWLDAIW